MKYIHVKNLEKYHPGYKDRILLWAKIHIKMIQGDPDCEMITDETDWARLIKFILLELNAQKPIPLDPLYLQRKGFNLKKRPIDLTINMLQTFIEVVSITDTECIQDVTHIRVEKSREEKKGFPPSLDSVLKYFKELKQTGEAEKFFDYYQSNGWKVGKNIMKDWKAAARNWCKRNFGKKKEEVGYKPFEEKTEKRPDYSPEGLAKVSKLIKGITNK